MALPTIDDLPTRAEYQEMVDEPLPDRVPTWVPLADFLSPYNQMQYWYNELTETDVPVPETRTVSVIESVTGTPTYDTDEVIDVVDELGGTAFVRSEYKASYTARQSKIPDTNPENVEYWMTEFLSTLAMQGLPVGEQLWLREWLDLDWAGDDLDPWHPEIRAFIDDGEVLCWHLRDADELHNADEIVEDVGLSPSMNPVGSLRAWLAPDWEETVSEYAQAVADQFEGSWSVDFVKTTDGDWYCTDMALRALTPVSGEWNEMSGHPGNCEHQLVRHLPASYLDSDDRSPEGVDAEAEQLIEEMEMDTDA
ncbi:hypothetical protein [Halosegnis longus]|uniref:hypothetical protein n=1 Tax=Halosegnis longus TaxID=2216012 RepID=UPI00129EBAB9|nr:hypothetical protein [Halosegnis longus]